MIIGSKIVRAVPGSTENLADCQFQACFEIEIICPVTKRAATLFVVAILPNDDRDAEEVVGLILRASGCDEQLASGLVQEMRRRGGESGSVDVERN